MDIIHSLTHLYRQYKSSISYSEPIRLGISLVGIFITGTFYKNTRNHLITVLGGVAVEYLIKKTFKRLENYLKPEENETHMKIYIVSTYLENIMEITLNSYQIYHLNNLVEYLPITSYFSFIPSLLVVHYKLKIYANKIKVIVNIIIFILLSLITPLLYYFLVRLNRHLNNLLNHTNSTNFRIIALRIQQAIQNGTSFRISYQNLEILTIPNRPGQQQLDEAQLEEIAPTQVPQFRETNIDHFAEEQCSICHEVYDETRQLYRILPNCRHSFHCHCIDKWFFSGHSVCPLCRTELRPPSQTEPEHHRL